MTGNSNRPRYDPPSPDGADPEREPVPRSTMELLRLQEELRRIDADGNQRLSAYELSNSDEFSMVIALLGARRITAIRDGAARNIDDDGLGSTTRRVPQNTVVPDEVIFSKDDLVAALTATYELSEQDIRQELDRMFRSIEDVNLSDVCPPSICTVTRGGVIVYAEPSRGT